MKTKFILKVSYGLILLVFLIGTFLPVHAGALDHPNQPVGATAEPPHPILSTLEVRQAIAYCTDRFALARAAYPDLTDAEIETLMMDSFLPEDNWAYHKPTVQYPYTPLIGKALLVAAGWTLPTGEVYRVNPDGERLALKLTTSQTEPRYAWAEVLEAQLLECGIQLLRFHANSDWLFGGSFTGLSRRDFEIGGFTWLYEDTGGFEQPVGLFGCDYIPSVENGWGVDYNNLMGWCNPVASEAAQQAGNLDLTQEERKPFFATLQEEFAKDMPSLPLFQRPDAVGYEHIDFNFSVPPPSPAFLQDVGLRRAIAYCTDRFALTKAAFPDLTDAEIEAMLTDSFLPADHWAYAGPAMTYPYDPQAGKDLLDSLGWTLPDGENYRTNGANERLAVVLSTTDSEKRLAWGELFEQQMLDCGILAPRFHVDSDWFLYHALRHRDFELGAFSWIVGEADGFYELLGCDQIPSLDNGWTGLNYAGWCNPVASAAAEMTSNLNLTQEQRKPYFATLQEEFAEDLPWLVLYAYWDDDQYVFEHIEFYLTYLPKFIYLPLTLK